MTSPNSLNEIKTRKELPVKSAATSQRSIECADKCTRAREAERGLGQSAADTGVCRRGRSRVRSEPDANVQRGEAITSKQAIPAVVQSRVRGRNGPLADPQETASNSCTLPRTGPSGGQRVSWRRWHTGPTGENSQLRRACFPS